MATALGLRLPARREDRRPGRRRHLHRLILRRLRYGELRKLAAGDHSNFAVLYHASFRNSASAAFDEQSVQPPQSRRAKLRELHAARPQASHILPMEFQRREDIREQYGLDGEL